MLLFVALKTAYACYRGGRVRLWEGLHRQSLRSVVSLTLTSSQDALMSIEVLEHPPSFLRVLYGVKLLPLSSSTTERPTLGLQKR